MLLVSLHGGRSWKLAKLRKLPGEHSLAKWEEGGDQGSFALKTTAFCIFKHALRKKRTLLNSPFYEPKEISLEA